MVSCAKISKFHIRTKHSYNIIIDYYGCVTSYYICKLYRNAIYMYVSTKDNCVRHVWILLFYWAVLELPALMCAR